MAINEKTSPAVDWADITASDTEIIEPTPTAFFIGTGGDVVCESYSGNTATFTVQGGRYLLVQPKRILATGTTASGIVALYTN